MKMSEGLFNTPHPVSDDDVLFFRENGYVRFDNVLTLEELEIVRRGMDQAREQKKGFVRDLAGDGGDGMGSKQSKILQMLNLWESFPEIKQYIFGKRISDIARKLTGSETLRLYHDQALVKEPGPSAPSPWHQDQPYWPSKEPGMISCWMALDDVTIERGCMQFIPGSHKWGEFPPMSFAGDGPVLEDLLSDAQKAAWNPVPVELSAGSCTFHHGLTFHFTNANTTQQVRRALVTIFIPEGVTYAADEKMDSPFSATITSRKGEPLQGEKFVELP